jgi:hypothetical protein
MLSTFDVAWITGEVVLVAMCCFSSVICVALLFDED